MKLLVYTILTVGIFMSRFSIAQNLNLVEQYDTGDKDSYIECVTKGPVAVYLPTDERLIKIILEKSSTFYLKAVYDGTIDNVKGRWGAFRAYYLIEAEKYGYSRFNQKTVYIQLDKVTQLETKEAAIARVQKKVDAQNSKERKLKTEKILSVITPLLIGGLIVLCLIGFVRSSRHSEPSSNIPLSKNRVPDIDKYVSGKQLRSASLFSFVGSSALAWLLSNYLYKLENPYSEPGYSIWIITVPIGLCICAAWAHFLPKVDHRKRITCPNCKCVFLKDDILTGSTHMGSSTYQGTRTEKADVKDNSGQVVGTMEYSAPYSYTVSNYKNHYCCKECNHKWTW